MRPVYAVLALLGAALPMVFFVRFFSGSAPGDPGFLAAAFANPAAGGLSTDLVISSVTFWAWMATRRGGPRPWGFIVVNLLIGLSCALPAYLYVLEGRREGAR
ncbi:MAG: DUF2834 domain-containing protein [Gemmatimonadota bacterium]